MALKDIEDSRSIVKKGIGDAVDRYTGRAKQYDKQAAAARANRIDEDNEVAVARGKRPASTDSMQASPTSLKDVMSDGIEKDFNLDYTASKMRAEKQAATAKANRKEAAAEGTRFAKGGRVTGYRGYGRAKTV